MTITPWPLVSYVTRKVPTQDDPRGEGVVDPANTNDPGQYFDVPAAIIKIITPTRLLLAVLSYKPFDTVADEFNPGAPQYGTFKRLGPTLLSETFVVDPPNILAGAQLVPVPFAVAGAAMGDTVQAGFSLPLQGMQLTAEVSAAGQVTVVIRNGTAGAINLASGTLRIDVWKH